MDGLRLHIGASCVYLTDGYVNVDVWGSGAALASDCPGGVERWGTTSDNYYARIKHIDDAYLGGDIPDKETLVCDAYGSWTNLPFEDETVAEVYSIQSFEHLSKTESHYAMAELRRVMKSGANLRLSVPDHEQTLQEYIRLQIETAAQADMERKIALKRKAAFMLRHLLGERKQDWAYHMGSWTKPKLIEFCRTYGFRLVDDETNINFYPSICLRFEKLGFCGIPELDDPIHPWKAAWEYCGENNGLLTVPDNWKVLEVGPGTAPWPRANAYCDIVERDLPNFTQGDVKRLPYPDNAFDFILISHVMEHVDDPVVAAAELNRVAKNGVMISPTPFKEGMMLAHEQDHCWWVTQGVNTVYFLRLPPLLYPTIYDQQISGEMHRIWRYGERRFEGLANRCKRHFHQIERLIDVVHFWSPEKPLKVVVLE